MKKNKSGLAIGLGIFTYTLRYLSVCYTGFKAYPDSSLSFRAIKSI